MSRQSERKRIRHKVVEVLKKADITGIGQSVFPQRSIDTSQNELPAVLVYTKSESIERNDESPKTYKRTCLVELEILSVHDDDNKLSDELDDLSQKVEDAMESTYDFLNMEHSDSCDKLINDFELSDIEIKTDGAGSNPFGKVNLVYSFEYYTNEDRQEALKDFERFETEYNVNGNKDGEAKELCEF